MFWSQTFIPTLREEPADAVIDSHKLLLRGGYIRQLTAGVYSYLPLMQRVLSKLQNIVREEMNAAGAIEITMPVLHPAELWQKTGRWDIVGKEQMRMKDRHQRDLVLGGTHEEVITWLIRGELRSYRQLPKNLYQIQTKFRDEPRPRFGLMRGREFIMKDAYSFDTSYDGLKIAYNKMAEAYFKAFHRCGLDVKMVESDVGAMGGTLAHEFMVPVNTQGGEAVILDCDRCDYTANIEKATSLSMREQVVKEEPKQKQMVFTPGMKTIEEVTGYLKVQPEKLIKTLLYVSDGETVAALIRGDRDINEIKLQNHLRSTELTLAPPDVVVRTTGAQVGFAGPIGLKQRIRIVADSEIKIMQNFVVGANTDDTHIINVNLSDFTVDDYAEIRLAQAGEICPRCNAGRLVSYSGIEVGNLFMLGTKYSDALGATFLDSDGAEKPFIMGSYGIGITRTAQATVEAFHDEKGIIWPRAIAPYDFHIVVIDVNNEKLCEVAMIIYEELQSRGFDVLYDDRDDRPGVKFNDADLIGLPVRISIGDRSLKEGNIEIVRRKGLVLEKVPVAQAVERAIQVLEQT